MSDSTQRDEAVNESNPISNAPTENPERLRYAGGTTKHDGPGYEKQGLTAVSMDELGVDDIQPGVGGPSSREDRTEDDSAG